jgi:hypothetical protein
MTFDKPQYVDYVGLTPIKGKTYNFVDLFLNHNLRTDKTIITDKFTFNVCRNAGREASFSNKLAGVNPYDNPIFVVFKGYSKTKTNRLRVFKAFYNKT